MKDLKMLPFIFLVMILSCVNGQQDSTGQQIPVQQQVPQGVQPVKQQRQAPMQQVPMQGQLSNWLDRISDKN